MPFLKYLLDTNTISERLRDIEPVGNWLRAHEQEMAISVITLGELKRGIEIRQQGKARRELERALRFVLQDLSGAIWVFDEGAAMEWGRLMGEAKARSHPLPFADSLIGAIARNMGAKVVSRDTKGFAGCSRVDPWTDVEYPVWGQSVGS